MISPFDKRANAAEPAKLSETEENVKKQLSDDERAAEVRLKNSIAHDNERLTKIKESLADKTFSFMEKFAIFAAIVFWFYISSHFSKGNPIPENVMIAFITTTLATVLGLVGFILKGLFGSK